MNKRKILALLLAVVMICSLFVSPALAADDEGIVAISDTAAPKFTDVKDHWAESAINRWAEEGIIEGDGDGTVQPGRNLKRAELATILTRLLGLKDKAPADTFSDVAATDWYADAVLKCAKAGIMLGDGTGKANPETSIDRQQAIVMIGRAVGVKPASGDSLDRFQDGDKVAAWAAPYMIALTNMDILNGLPVDGGFVIAPNEDINRASTFTLLDKAIAKYVTGPSTVTVDNANKFVIINSAAAEAGTVTVTGKAAGVVVAVGTTDNVVLDKAEVGTLKVDAPVDVTVSRGSSVADLDANAAADVTNNGTVTNLNTNADDVTFDGNKPSKVNTAEGVKPATDSKGNEVTDKPASSGGNTPSVVRADVVPAPLFDQAGSNAIPADQLGDVTVSSRRTALTNGVPTYEVTLTGKNIMNHNNAQQRAGHWVGFGMPAKVAAEDDAVKSYTYEVNGAEVVSIAGRTYEANGKTYNTVYFSEENDGSYADYTIVVKDGATVVANYVVKFDVTFKSDYAVTMTAELSEELLKAYDDAGLPIRHKTAAGLGLNAAVSGNTMTLTGTTTLAKLEATVSGAAGNDGYVLYAMNVGDAVIKKIKTGVATYELADFEVDGLANGYLMNTKIYDGANKMLLDNTVEIELLDANDRVQGKISQTFKATACSIEGLKKATFGDTVLMGETSVTAPAVPANTDEVYYTGNWVSGDKKVAANGTYTFGAEKEITFTAEYVEIGGQELKTRPNGPANNGETDCNYGEVYAAAGVTLTGTPAEYTYTIDATTFLNYADTQDNKLGVLAAKVGEKTYYFYGVAIMAPADATTLVLTKDNALTSLDNADKRTEFDLANSEHSFTIGDQECILHYFGAVADKDSEGVYGFQPDGAFTRYAKWVDSEGNITVNKIVLNRKTTPAELTVTFKNGETEVDSVKVEYNKTIDAVDIPADPEKEDNIFLGWVDADGNAADFTAAITADVTYTAKWATVTAVSDVEVIIGAVPQKLGITATEYADGKITFTVDKAAFQAAWMNLSDAEKTQLEHEGSLFVRVNFTVPEDVDETWSFVGSTDNGETWRGEVSPFNKDSLNAVGLDVTEVDGKIVKLGQWFGIATVTTETTGEGDEAVTTPVFSFPDANTWINLYKWVDADGNVQFTTFELTRAVVEGTTPEVTE